MKVWVVIEIEETISKEPMSEQVGIGQSVRDLMLFKKEADARKCVADLYSEYCFYAKHKSDAWNFREIVVPPTVEADSFCDCGAWLNYMVGNTGIDYKVYIKECEVEKW